ncbi:putative glycosyltransferase [Listeria riparia FSL S10-1204]|uniref:Putative glycosyltransferase n=2 Tax=Listeria riparia TaxID=1494964 RepID=W7CV85_9LIST|nr:putative glycosyltransferase [Listeria riparia FSL S10-1204]
MMKRGIDIVFAISIGLVALVPIFVSAMLFLILYRETPFYVSIRAGKQERSFKIYKLKSMRQLFDENGEALPDYMRITKFGQFLRKYSIDELPQLWNILVGDMSLVGPRPLPVAYNSLYNQRQRKRLSVKPGLTGLAQVNGRNAISWEEKFELDAQYVEQQSLKLDSKIILQTIGKVFRGADISQEDHVTVEIFQGTTK